MAHAIGLTPREKGMDTAWTKRTRNGPTGAGVNFYHRNDGAVPTRVNVGRSIARL